MVQHCNDTSSANLQYIMTNYVVSYYPSVLLLFAIASIAAAISVAPFLLSTKSELHQLCETLKIVIPHLGTVFASLILPLWLWFICRKKTWECSGQITCPRVTGLRLIVETDNDDISILSDEESPLLGVQHIQKAPSSIRGQEDDASLNPGINDNHDNKYLAIYNQDYISFKVRVEFRAESHIPLVES